MSILRGVRQTYCLFGLQGIALVTKARLQRRPIEVAVYVPGVKYPIHLRLRTTDVSLFSEILLKSEYDCGAIRSPKVILDAGANIGVASVFFANKYPDAQIIAIEPEASNFQLLVKNTAQYPRITCIEAALWNSDTTVTLADPGGGNWAFRTLEAERTGNPTQRQTVEAITVHTLMNRLGLDRIDLMKVDIEGAEREVFGGTPLWIDKVGLIAIELHDAILPGCSRAVYLATRDFQWEFKRGETIFLGRGESGPNESVISDASTSSSNALLPKGRMMSPCRIVQTA